MTTKNVIITGPFDQMDHKQIRFIHQASKLGSLHVILFDDALVEKTTGTNPEFPLPERIYFVENIRYVKKVHTINNFKQLDNIKNSLGITAHIWAAMQDDPYAIHAAQKQNLDYRCIGPEKLDGCPEHDYDLAKNSAKKVIVTGCFDWLHSGHVRFFEEASQYGSLYVALGNDENLQQLKGLGHPMFCQDIRKYLVGSIRFVTQALISTGFGWLDAESVIEKIKPDIYITNEDGDKPIKRDYCIAKGIEYKVLKRLPKDGLTRRTSTNLRGF